MVKHPFLNLELSPNYVQRLGQGRFQQFCISGQDAPGVLEFKPDHDAGLEVAVPLDSRRKYHGRVLDKRRAEHWGSFAGKLERPQNAPELKVSDESITRDPQPCGSWFWLFRVLCKRTCGYQQRHAHQNSSQATMPAEQLNELQAWTRTFGTLAWNFGVWSLAFGVFAFLTPPSCGVRSVRIHLEYTFHLTP